MKTIFIDMDGVLCDLDKGLLKITGLPHMDDVDKGKLFNSYKSLSKLLYRLSLFSSFNDDIECAKSVI